MKEKIGDDKKGFSKALNEIFSRISYHKPISLRAERVELDGYEIVELEKYEYMIRYGNERDFYRALGVLVSGAKCGRGKSRIHAGFMLDCSKNAVPTVETVKTLVIQLALTGYDSLYLYVEDCIEVETDERIGYMRGRYTKAEIKEIDDFCALFGIKLIPAIQTLGHFGKLFYNHVRPYIDIYEYEDILLAENEPTYAFLSRVIKAVRDCFTSDMIHIGMNDARQIGLGEYLKTKPYKPRADILKTHINRVCDICKKYGFTPTVFTDMIVDFVTEKEGASVENFASYRSDLPSELRFMNFPKYKSQDPAYETEISTQTQSFDNFVFACNIYKDLGFAPFNAVTETQALPAVKACAHAGVREVVCTAFSDDGAECPLFSILPSLVMLSKEWYDDEIDAEGICRVLCGYTLQELYTLDLPNNPLAKPSKEAIDPAKYLLYEDLLMSRYDLPSKVSFRENYKAYTETLKRYARRESPYSYLFTTAYRLCKVLSLKSGLSEEIRKACLERDYEKIREVENTIQSIIKAVRKLYEAVRKQWLTENKQFGLEVLALRLGGLEERLKTVKEVLRNGDDGDLMQLLSKRICPQTEVARIEKAMDVITYGPYYLPV